MVKHYQLFYHDCVKDQKVKCFEDVTIIFCPQEIFQAHMTSLKIFLCLLIFDCCETASTSIHPFTQLPKIQFSCKLLLSFCCDNLIVKRSTPTTCFARMGENPYSRRSVRCFAHMGNPI